MTSTPPNPTIETALGVASYGVSPDGTLWMDWNGGLTLHRVRYTRASAYQERSKYSGTVFTHVHMHREEWGKPISNAAVALIRKEAERLAVLLVTPEAVARAKIKATAYNVGLAEREVERAQEAETRARAELAEARRELESVQTEQGQPAA